MRPAAQPPAAPAPPRRRWPPWLRRTLTAVFFALVGALLVTQARRVEWSDVLDVLRGYPLHSVLAAAAFAALAHAVYATYDLLGRRWTRHTVDTSTVVAITFVSYAFNLNLGSWLGGFAFRYRLYSRFGLDAEGVTRVLGLSLVTNWLGYCALGGAVFAMGGIAPPDDWRVGVGAVRALGVAMLAAVAFYLLLCGLSRRREWHWRGHLIALPPLGLALWQAVLSVLHWSCVAAIPFVLLQSQLTYATVLGTLLIGAVAGVIAHIPAGLGVLEAVFIALLGHRVSQGELLAVLLAYRALYYLLPLALACALFLTLEAKARKRDPARTGTPLAEPVHRPR